jgi:hypothetical protein
LRPFGRNDSIRNHIVQVFGGVGWDWYLVADLRKALRNQ